MQALAAGLEPILCVGESLAEHEAGTTEAVVGAQLDAALAHAGVQALGRGVIAYEPVWAIGTGKTAMPEQAQAVHAFIRARIAKHDAQVASNLRILYGGSVKAANAKTLFACKDIDGGLVGGASLQAQHLGIPVFGLLHDLCTVNNARVTTGKVWKMGLAGRLQRQSGLGATWEFSICSWRKSTSCNASPASSR